MDQFVAAFKTLGPPPGVLPRKASLPDISGLGIEGGEEGDEDDFSEEDDG